MSKSTLYKGDILIVDDQLMNLKVLITMLTEQGYRVRSADSGPMALEIVRKFPPDLILLDIKMPDMDGYKVCEHLKANEQTRDIPIIFVTILDETEDKVKAFAAGGVDYVTKPFRIQEVLARVETHLTLRAVQKQLEEKNARLEQEIVERALVEEALRESEERYRVVVEDMPVLICRFLPDGTLSFVNEAYCEYFDKKREDLIGRNFFQFISAKDRERVKEFYGSLCPEKSVITYEHQVVAPDGTMRWQRWTDRAIFDERETLVEYQSIGEDITERKRAEEALRESEKQLRQQEQLAAIGRLAGGIAHDFNNLMATIILCAQMSLARRDLPAKAAEAFDTILDESRRAAKLVQQILDFSRRSVIEARPLDLVPFAKETISVLRRTLPEDIRITLDTPDAGREVSPAPLTVKVDPTRIQQALINLALNARDAMPEGGELRIGLERLEVAPGESLPWSGGTEEIAGRQPPVASQAWVCLTVADTGVGMTGRIQTHLFEPFFTTKPVGEGTGLGLAQVYGIVKQHDGYIRVETAEGEGTTFRIYLPAYEEEVETEKKKRGKLFALPPGKGETILLVEDAERLRKAMQEILESLGYRALTATNGQDALEIFQSAEEINLVITDLVMPKMGGKQLLRTLRKESPGLKALAITGYVMEADLQELEKAGFLGVVHKPFDAERLAKMLRYALDAD